MRRPHLIALPIALTLTATLALVVRSEPSSPARLEFPAQVLAAVANATTTTSTTIFVFPEDLAEVPGVLDEELELIDEVVETVTTTSTTSTTIAVASLPAPAPAPAAKPEPPPPTTTTTQPPPSNSIEPRFMPGLEAEFQGRINSLRSANGLAALSRDGSLHARARDWAKTLAAKGSLQHSNVGTLVPPWSTAGENLGKGGSVSVIFDLLTGSSSHYENMVRTTFTSIGVGVWMDAEGTLWTVHVFAG